MAAFAQAIARLAIGEREAALPFLEAALKEGEGALANLNLGMALADLGRLDAAEPHLRAAAAALPEHAEPLFRLGLLAALRRRDADARGFLVQALALARTHVPVLVSLASMDEAQGKLEEAQALLLRARALDAHEPELAVIDARLALAAGDEDAALETIIHLLARCPDHAGGACLLADILLAMRSVEEARPRLQAAMAAEPFASCWPLAAAKVESAGGEHEAALAHLRTAEALAPDSSGVLAELGRCLAQLGRHAEAEPFLRRASLANPTDLVLRNLLITSLWKAHRYGEMLELLDTALADFGSQPTLEMNRALVLNAMGLQDEALAAAELACSQQPGVSSFINRINMMPYNSAHGTAGALLDAGLSIAEAVASHPLSTAAVPAVVRQPGDVPGGAPGERPGDKLGLNLPNPTPRTAAPRGPVLIARERRRLRVGLLSGGLGVHPVGWLTLAGLEALPERDFELIGYNLRPRKDPLAARFRMRCSRWRDVGFLSEAAVGAAIRDDECDIVLEMGGYGDAGRPFGLLERPAPVQIKWVGSQFGTTGLPFIDWMLTDQWETPEGFDRFYTEKLLRMPDGYACYLPPAYAPAVGPLPAVRNGHITFGCFNNLAKVTAEVLECWGTIMRSLPDARLVLRTHALKDQEVVRRLKQRLTSVGIAPSRVSLHGSCPHHELLAAYNEIDIALDPFPYTGGLTVCEALWMGVPVVGMAGTSFAGRHVLSHCSNIGMADWVSEDLHGYVSKAVARAVNLPGLAATRASLRGRVAASPLCDAPRFGANLASALRHAWEAQ